MLRYLPFVLSLALTIYCMVEAIQAKDDAVRGLPKIGWLLAIALVPVIGPVAWLVAGRPRRGGSGIEQRRPRGPDDDPDFLKDL